VYTTALLFIDKKMIVTIRRSRWVSYSLSLCQGKVSLLGLDFVS